MFRKILTIAVTILYLGIAPAYAADTNNIMFIVDASGSMKEKVGMQTRMEAAKDVLGETLENIPENVNLGLLVYGHRKAKDCGDIELVSPLGGDDAATLQKIVSGLVAQGETPIAESIKQASKSFSAFEGQNNKIILVTDGLEECEGDPCAAAKEAKASGLDVTVDVVGFTLGDKEAKSVQCITEATGGKYYGAADTQALTTALQEAAVEPEPVLTTVFEDSFEGAELSESWEVINTDPEQYIVEKGNLMLIGKDVGGLSNAESSNVIQLTEELPAGDWTVTVEVTPEFQTSKDLLSFGLYTDNKNFVATSLFGSDRLCCDVGSKGYGVALMTEKVSGGAQTKFEIAYAGPEHSPNHTFKQYIEEFGKTNTKTIVQFIKEGRNYKSRVHKHGQVDENGEALWFETDVISSLRAPKQFVINAGQTEANDGESIFEIHSIKIESRE